MHLFLLYSTSIICGFCMMALEMMGGRYLQPVFGSGIDVWSAIITVFILSLSLGYVLGGRLADRFRSNLALGWVIVLAGSCYFILPALALPVTDAIGSSLHGNAAGVLIAALVLFFFPSLLLGCVSPMLVKLVFDDPSRIGRITGTLYAIGSFGNVMGILVSTYVMMSLFAINDSMFGMGAVLCATGMFHCVKRMETRALAGTATPSAGQEITA